jgi:hypothetical protein
LGFAKSDKVTLRKIIRLLNQFLANAHWQQIVPEQRFRQLYELGCTYPLNYLLFDFCLAALSEDNLDARLYLAHSFHILALPRAFNLLLSVIVNQPLTSDKDARELLTLLAQVAEPRNAESYIDVFGEGFAERYDNYDKEKKQLLQL